MLRPPLDIHLSLPLGKMALTAGKKIAMAISAFAGVNLAVPDRALLKPGEANELAFNSNYWRHLVRYITAVGSLPEAATKCSPQTDAALQSLRSAAKDFGSPRDLRQLVMKQADALADAQLPATFYAGIAWLAQNWHGAGAFVVATLQSIAEPVSANDRREGLQLLGGRAQDARTALGPMIGSLREFKARIFTASGTLAASFGTEAENLHRLQEAVGALQVETESVRKQIGEIGILGARRKHDLEAQLQSLQQELESKSAQAETLRGMLGKLEPIREEASWLEPSLDDLIEFFAKSRRVWTAFGSGLTQLVADASDNQLEDLAWVKKALGFDEAITRWQAIDQAAKRFIATSLADID